MSVTYNAKVLLSATTSTNGEWYPLDYKYTGCQQRAYIGTVTSGDNIVLQVAVDDPIQEGTTAGVYNTFVNVTSFSSDFSGVIEGNWTAIRAVKTGSSGFGFVKIVG